MTRRERYLECAHILSTLANYGPLHASDLADRVNTECDYDEFDGLPEIARRGMGAKLNGYSQNGMVRREYAGEGLPPTWRLTEHGQNVVRVFRASHSAPREGRHGG